MPRKTSQAAAKEASAADAKNEGVTRRRSGRAVARQDAASKDATRSRRSSTAAQTAASVADSKTPKGRPSRRDSASPSDSRTRSGRDGVESPATRVKSTRRSTSRINYKESDGEEEAPAPKFDEKFDSGDEPGGSETDEKPKTGGRSRPSRSTAKSPAVKAKPKQSPAQGRRARSNRGSKANEEENETVNVSDDSAEPEEVTTKKGRVIKAKEPPKTSSRSKRQKAEIVEVESKTEKPRQSRRSSRSTSNKEESSKKRPARGGQAKHYTEEEEEEVEEITDPKLPGAEEDDEMKEEDSGRKRKRSTTPEDANKRLKEETDDKLDEDVVVEKEEKEEEDIIKEEEKKEEKPIEKEDISVGKLAEEPMEVEESDSLAASEAGNSSEAAKEEEKIEDPEIEEVDKEKEIEDKNLEDDNPPTPKEELSESNKRESIESLENLDESMHSSDSGQPNQGIEDSPDIKEIVQEDTAPEPVTSIEEEKVYEPKDLNSRSPESYQELEENSEDSKSEPVPVVPEVINLEKTEDKVESNLDSKPQNDGKDSSIDNCDSEESKESSVDEVLIEEPGVTESSVPLTTDTQSKDSIPDVSQNGPDKKEDAQNSEHDDIYSVSKMNSEHTPEKSAPKANGAHNDVELTHSKPPSHEQYYSLPGRRYVINSKLSESLRQSLKDKIFGFASYNLGSSPDAYLQKEKLVNELGNLNAQIICLQQVARPFYTSVLEPSLDALGFKSVFSQPEDSLKGMATFFKSSLFRLNEQSNISLKQLIEKDLEASSLDIADRSAVKAHIRKCGNVLFAHLSSTLSSQTFTVANVQIPPTDFSINALQVSCLAKEVVKINGGTNKPLLLGGEFNIAENDASYQLLRDGYLSNDMIEELQRRKDVALPGKESASLVNLLWKSFQHPSSNLCSCYTSVLDHEFFIPELKTASPDLLWFSSDSLHTMGVLDAVTDVPGGRHFSLKADVAFSV